MSAMQLDEPQVSAFADGQLVCGLAFAPGRTGVPCLTGVPQVDLRHGCQTDARQQSAYSDQLKVP